MKISEKITPSLINTNLKSKVKEKVFEEVVDIFIENDLLKDREAALKAIFEREAKMSTGITRGLAIPHGKIAEAQELMMAIGIFRKGVEYDSLDGEPVYVVIMVFAETSNPGPHIEALAEISRLCAIPGFTRQMAEAQTPEEVVRLIRDAE